MIALAALILASLGVGVLIGAVGIGGILLIPALTSLGGLSTHEAMATALFSFLFTGLTGMYFFHRRASIDWRITIPLCLGALLLGFSGAALNAKVSAGSLRLVLALFILFAGVYTIREWRRSDRALLQARPALQRLMLFCVGSIVGFGSGLTGVGGPALSVPIMMLLGFAPLATIGASQVVQVLAAFSGTMANLRYGSIDFGLVAIVTLAEVLGVAAGVRIVHKLNVKVVRRFVALLCIVAGTVLLAHAWPIG